MAFHGVSSSSSFNSRWTYDVFLSFRGEDTRKAFTAHLYADLLRSRINTFMDDKLRSGEEISPTLIKAIEESAISIIVFSKNFASSRWCLDELIKILECRKTRGQKVLPLFYDVEPSEIRHQNNSVGQAFAKLEERFKDNEMKVKKWKTALIEVANLSGRPLGNKNEPEFIREIVVWVNSILVNKTHFQVAQYPIRIESRVQDVKSLLDIEKNDTTCMVGIFGIGGIGKTTIAKAIYNSIAFQFEGSCFLGDIRETSSQIGGLVDLQKQLLSKILGDSSLTFYNVDQGITLIKERLRSLKVLLVLDDVDKLVQLKKLAGKDDWFGLGSRIIITTRDKSLLRKHGIDSVYRMNELDHNDALQLFSWNAFKSNKPKDDFVELTEHVISYAGGLPLALVVLGSDLYGKDLDEWKSALDKYKRIPNKEIQDILKISYDGLEDVVKNVFLDIACFFKGQELGHVSRILDKCGFFPNYGIPVLVNKSLISIDYHWEYHKIQYCKVLGMHDLLQKMGREIVRQESPKEPGKRSRLWFHEDVRHVLEESMGTNKIEGILIDLPNQDLIVNLSPKTFKTIKRLRLFICRNACFSEEPIIHSNELRLIDWAEYSGESLPSNICGKNLVTLRMTHSRIKTLEGVQNFQNITCMGFRDCEFLIKIPDVSRCPNLKELYLDGCKSLDEVHCSVGFLDKLVFFSLTRCPNVRSFPRSFKLRSLKFLRVCCCRELENYPEIECEMECIQFIYFFTGIKELPSSIGYLVVVKALWLSNCTNLTNLPKNICQLNHLKELRLSNCCIKELPSSIGDLVGSNARFSAKPIIHFNELRLIDWAEYSGESLPSNICGKNLVTLRMTHSRIKTLEGVQNFQNIICMSFRGCEFLIKIPDVSRCPNLKKLYLDGCKSLDEVHCSVGFLDKLVFFSLTRCPNVRSFPRSFKLRSLKFLEVYRELENYPEIECEMECIQFIYFFTGIKELPSSIGYLIVVKSLMAKQLHKRHKSSKEHLSVESFEGTSSLETLTFMDFYNCKLFKKFLKKFCVSRTPNLLRLWL